MVSNTHCHGFTKVHSLFSVPLFINIFEVNSICHSNIFSGWEKDENIVVLYRVWNCKKCWELWEVLGFGFLNGKALFQLANAKNFTRDKNSRKKHMNNNLKPAKKIYGAPNDWKRDSSFSGLNSNLWEWWYSSYLLFSRLTDVTFSLYSRNRWSTSSKNRSRESASPFDIFHPEHGHRRLS